MYHKEIKWNLILMKKGCEVMDVPIPCDFGFYSLCKNKFLEFCGVSWFKWTSGYEYTYFFTTKNEWIRSEFFTSNGKECRKYLDIDDALLVDKAFVEHGYPLKGSGYLIGIKSIDGELYAELILTSHYLTHLKVECDEHGHFITNGKIIFPPTPSCETLEKRKSYLMKKYEHLVK